MSERALGRRYEEDLRDQAHLARSFLRDEAPVVIITRPYHYNWVPTPLFPMDQGAMPWCVAYTGEALLRAGPVINRSTPHIETAYREAQNRDEWEGNNYDGTSARGLMKYYRELGYIDRWVNAFDVSTIRLWHLGMQLPGMLGINWYSSFYGLTPSGFLTLSPTAHVQGGHEVFSLGWDDRRGALRCLNSWGKGYGQNGRFWISGEVLERLMQEDGDFVSPTELRKV